MDCRGHEEGLEDHFPHRLEALERHPLGRMELRTVFEACVCRLVGKWRTDNQMRPTGRTLPIHFS